MSLTTTPSKNCAKAGSASPSPRQPTPLREMSPNTTHNIQDCSCATCQYYRAAMIYAHETQSPPALVEQYAMYAAMMAMAPYSAASPSMPMTELASSMPSAHQMPFIAHPYPQPQHRSDRRRQTQSPQHHSNSGSVAPSIPQTEEEQLAAFKSCIGSIATTACTSQGRSLLQAIMRMQNADLNNCIFEEVMASLETVALDTHGCHVVRSMIDVLTTEQVAEFVEKLPDNLILNMATLTQYTRRVIQGLFERHANCNLQRIVDIVSANSRYLAATQQGCIALMRVLESCGEEQRKNIVEPLLPVLSEVAADPYGNYVVQCILENVEKEQAGIYVRTALTGKYLRMACNKFASNVLEKILQNNFTGIRRDVVDELIFNPAALQQLVQDSFGNFVVQTLLESSPHQAEHRKICERLKPVLGTSPYGHKIESKMRTRRFQNNQHRNQRNRENFGFNRQPVEARAN